LLHKRETGLTEIYPKLCHNHANGTTNLAGMIQLVGTLTLERVIAALKRMQQRHPVLRSFWHGRKGRNDFLAVDEQAKSLPLQTLIRNGERQWMEVMDQNMKMHFAEDDHYLWRFTLIHGDERRPATHEFLVTFQHAISDGISTANFFDEFLNYLNQNDNRTLPYQKSLPFLPAV